MKKKSLPLPLVYKLIEPGPVILLTTRSDGFDNIMTLSWHTMLDFAPPLIGCVISDQSHTFEIIKKSRSCVINIPTKQMIKTIIGCGNTSGRRVDKFEKFKLHKQEASVIDAPLIEECYANLECEVVDTKMVKHYDFFVLEVVKAWIDPKVKAPKTLHHRGNGLFMVAGSELKNFSKMK